jgi:hypothetical protein
VKLLVVASCTKQKDKRDCPYELTESDFDDPVSRSRREVELARWALPAGRMYTGWQHRYMMNGIDQLRRKFGSSACSLKIISAGYGLIDEQRSIVPYEATFHGKSLDWVHQRAGRLGIPDAVRTVVQGFECVIFLLGKEYLLSTHPPLRPSSGQRFAFFTSNRKIPFTSDSTIVPAGKGELKYGAGYAAIKGKMFEHFVAGLVSRPQMWDGVCSDASSRTVLNLIENERGIWAASTT